MSFNTEHRTFDDSISRWASVGPYYAMFPIQFAFKVVKSYSQEGDAVLDPFAGRGSSVYAAAACGRSSVGMEINPVGWLYGTVKLRPTTENRVLQRRNECARLADDVDLRLAGLPEFFSEAYDKEVLRF